MNLFSGKLYITSEFIRPPSRTTRSPGCCISGAFKGVAGLFFIMCQPESGFRNPVCDLLKIHAVAMVVCLQDAAFAALPLDTYERELFAPFIYLFFHLRSLP